MVITSAISGALVERSISFSLSGFAYCVRPMARTYTNEFEPWSTGVFESVRAFYSQLIEAQQKLVCCYEVRKYLVQRSGVIGKVFLRI